MLEIEDVGQDSTSSEKVNDINQQSNESVELKEAKQPEAILEVSTDSDMSMHVPDSDMSMYVPCSSDEVCSSEEDRVLSPRRSTRIRKQTSFYKCHYVSTQENEPLTFQEAMKRPDASKWQGAISRELETLKENNTWVVCEKPVDAKTVSSKWVFKIKKSKLEK